MSEALDDLPEQMRVRREKLDRLRQEGVDPYPVTFPRDTTVARPAVPPPDTGSTSSAPGDALSPSAAPAAR